MPRLVEVVCALALSAVATGCPEMTETPEPLLGTWTRVDVNGVLESPFTRTYRDDATLEITGVNNEPFRYVYTWRRLSPDAIETCFDGRCDTEQLPWPDGDVFIVGDVLLEGPSGAYADTRWHTSSSGCCANGSSFSTDFTLELHGDGSAAYREMPIAQGPPGLSWNGTWSEAELGVAFAGGDWPLPGRIRVGDRLGTDAYRRTLDLR